MKFLCHLETSAENIRMTNILPQLLRAGYRLVSQKQQALSKGGNLVAFIAVAPKGTSQEQILSDLSNIKGTEIVKLTFPDSDSQADRSANSTTKSEQRVRAKNTDSTAAEKETLKDIGAVYPNFIDVVLTYSTQLSAEGREDGLFSLGEKLGGAIYQRDFSLGSPLKLDACITRELIPAIQEFCQAEQNGNSIVIQNNPFSSSSDATNGCNEFVCGFVTGFLESSTAIATVEVREIISQTKRSKNSTFRIEEQ